VQLAAACAGLIAGCFVGWRKFNTKKNKKRDIETSIVEGEGEGDLAQTAASNTDEEKSR